MSDESSSTASEISRLKKSRGTYKGHCTKAIAKLATMDTHSTQDIDFTMMDSMLESAHHTVKCLEEVNDELITVDPSHEKEHLSDLTKTLDSAETLIDSLTLKSQKGHACHEMEGILKYLTAFRFTEDSAPQQITRQIQRRDDLFVQAQGKYRRAVRSDSHLEGLTEAITDKLAEINSKLPEIDSPVGPSSSAPRYDRGSSDSSSSQRHRRLPQIETPKFTGNILEWDDFWVVFRRNVHLNKDLEEDEKLSYLQQSIKDKSQSNMVDAMAGSYADCIVSLKAKYEQPRLLHEHYSKMFFNCPPCKEDSVHELTRLHTTLSQARKKLNESKMMTADEIMSSYAESLLPPAAWRKWTETHTDQHKIPKLSDLLTFVELQAKLCSRPELQTVKKERERAPAKHRADPHRSDHPVKHERNLHAISHTSQTVHPCIRCEDTTHSLYGCPQFAGLTVDGRIDFVGANKLCYNCMGLGHDKRSCRSTYKCKTCGRKHHSMLHREQPAPAASSGVTPAGRLSAVSHHSDSPSSEEVQSWPTIAPTMKVTVLSPWGREADVTALFDGGATVSVITNKVAAQLGLKKKTSNMRLVQALGASTSSNTSTVQITVKSAHLPGETRQFTAVVVPNIGQAGTGRRLEPKWEALSELPLANPDFHMDKTIDLIIGQNISASIYLDHRRRNEDASLSMQETIWGWTVEGRVGRPQRLLNTETTATRTLDQATVASITLSRAQRDAEGDDLLKRFFEDEEVGEESTLSSEDHGVMTHFMDTHKILPDGRMEVTLPRKSDCGALGTSRGQALQRYLHNERSLIRRKALQPFQLVMAEYFTLQQAEVVPINEIQLSEHYYMPMHAVIKSTSTSTKLRIVFDASATTSSGLSLNDVLHIGPTVYPALTSILMRFRWHRLGITADISKMYREISLDPQDRNLHRFLWRKSPGDPILDCRMKRVTFGVASSPFLATQAIQQLAHIHKQEYPEASKAIQREFYVDDYISGADTPAEALHVQQQLCLVLGQHQLTLRKWRSSSNEVLSGIPSDLHETETSGEPYGHRHYLKTLGVQWNAMEDEFHVSVSDLTLPAKITKRALTSDVAKTFDVLGWFTPATLTMKTLIQRLWAAGSGWDEQVPDDVQAEWAIWRTELPALANQPISRPYFRYDRGTRQEISLHGFSDASLKGYAAVVYIRATYSIGSPSVTLVQAKSKVAPLKGLTVPRLELCGAQLLSRLITSVRTALDISVHQIQCWTDSQIVLFWLDGKTRPHRTYVANRVRDTLNSVPTQYWKHVPGIDNPADCASRGITPGALQAHGLWWHGPAWLSQDPIADPPQPHLTHLETSSEELVKGKSVSAITSVSEIFESRYSTFKRLRRTVAWIFRFVRNTKLKQDERPKHKRLSVADVRAAEVVLYRRAQRRIVTGSSFKRWKKERHIRSLNPTADDHGIYRVNGRLDNSALGFAQRNPIILEGKDILTQLIVTHHHIEAEHAGPTLLMSTLSRNHHIIRGLVTVKAIVRNCVICTRTRMDTERQMMGQLPKSRVTPSRPFSNVGTDFAGPITLKQGHTRRPVHIKGYVCLFVCMATKATHLEVVSSLTTEAFLSCLTRFVSRRGLPTCIYSDNGSNYVGAAKELEEVYQAMRREDTQQALAHYCVEKHITWSFSPARAPHFGGLWEAAVRSFKSHFRKLAKSTIFSYEEMATILCRIEMALNSRPLMPLHVHSSEGVDVLTPGHFLVGQPLNALPERRIDPDRHPRSRFILCQQLIQDFWRRWSEEYLRQLNTRTKWQQEVNDVKVGDIALIRGETTFQPNTWPLARIIKTHPGQDGLVRVVDLQCGGRVYRRPITKLTILVRSQQDVEQSENGSKTEGISLPPAGMSESDDSEQEEEQQEVTDAQIRN